jgi:hypothetical protein
VQNNRKLIETRKMLFSQLLYSYDINPVQALESEDEELIQMLIDDISTPVNNQLMPYAPVFANMLKHWLDTLGRQE